MSGSTSGTANFFEYYSLQSFLDNFVNFFFCGYYSPKLFSSTSLNIRKFFFLQLRRNFQTFPIVIRAVLSLFSEYVQFSFKLVHFSAFQIQINHGENIEFVDNKTLCIASAMAVLCNTLLCSVLAIFLQKQKSLHGTASV